MNEDSAAGFRHKGARDKHDQRISAAAAIAIAIFLHFGINAPLHVYLGNLTIFSFRISEFLGLTVGAASIAALAFGSVLYRALRGHTVRSAALIVWLVAFLIVGFQFAAFSSSGIIDGKEIDYSDVRIVLESVLFIIGAILVARLPVSSIQAISVAVALFVIGNTGWGLVKAWPLIRDQAKDPRAQQAHFAGKDIARVTSPMLPFFGTDYRDLPNLDTYSKENNVIIILVDTLQSDLAEEAIHGNEAIKAGLDGFVFFRNAAGLFPFTNFAVPALLSGEVYKENEPVTEYYHRADLNRVERSLAQHGFTSSYLGLWVRRAYVMGVAEAQREERSKLIAVTAFRQLPTLIKAAYFGSSYDFLGNQVGEISSIGSGSLDLQILNRMAKSIRADGAAPQFKYVHLWGGHNPSTLDRNCKPIPWSMEREAFLGQANCILFSVQEYISALKEKNLYDVSQIFIVADHGTQLFPIKGGAGNPEITDKVQSSAHPTILFKDFGKRGVLSFSDVAVSSLDIRSTILNRVAGANLSGRDLASIASESYLEREFFFYSSPEDMLDGQVERLEKYTVGPDVRSKNGWINQTLD